MQKKINAVNYLSKPPPPNEQCDYAEDSYAVNEQMRCFRPSYQGSNKENWRQGQGFQGRIYGNYNREGHYVWDGIYNRDNNLNMGNYGNKNDRNGPYVPPWNREVTRRDGGNSMARVEDVLHKMMRRFDANDEHIKELRSDLAGIRQKVNTHAISIKQIELQMTQLSVTGNTWQSGTLPSNAVQNPKNDAHCMAITTRGGKQTIDPPMSSNEENLRKDYDKVVKGSGEAEESSGKDAKVPMKVIPMPRPPQPFPQRLVKNTEDGKYQRFITMLKQLSINVPLVEALEQMPGYAKFMKIWSQRKDWSLLRMMIDYSTVVLLLQDPSYKRKKIRVRSLFLVQLGHYIFRKHYVILGQA